MSRFAEIRKPDGGSQLAALYDELIAAGLAGDEEGVPSNLVLSMSQRPDLLGATWAMMQSVMGGVVPATVKQMTLMAIALQNDCEYCSVVHTRALEGMGVPAEVIQSCASDPELGQVPPPQRAIIRFGLKAARDPKSITDEDFQQLRDQGMGDEEIMEITMLAAVGNLLDTWADVSGIQPNAG